MSVGILNFNNPTYWQNGSVVSANFLQALQDDVNGLLLGTASCKNLVLDSTGANTVTPIASPGTIVSLDRPQLFDTFAGQSVNAGNWTTPSGSVTIVDDSANGGNGTVKVDASGGPSLLATQPMAVPGDYLVRGRLRITGVTGSSSISFGFAGGSETAAFLIDGATSTTNWRVLVGNSNTAPNGTPVAISASYQEFEIIRVSGTTTFKINGTVLHTATTGAVNLAGDLLRLRSATAGILFADWVSFATVYGS